LKIGRDLDDSSDIIHVEKSEVVLGTTFGVEKVVPKSPQVWSHDFKIIRVDKK